MNIKATTLVCIFFAGMLLYGLAMPRLITFEDSGLFLQVCHTGSIAQSPGYLLFPLIGTPLFLVDTGLGRIQLSGSVSDLQEFTAQSVRQRTARELPGGQYRPTT
jgi:hypothetical protein